MDSTSAFSKYRNRFGYIEQGTIVMYTQPCTAVSKYRNRFDIAQSY